MQWSLKVYWSIISSNALDKKLRRKTGFRTIIQLSGLEYPEKGLASFLKARSHHLSTSASMNSTLHVIEQDKLASSHATPILKARGLQLKDEK